MPKRQALVRQPPPSGPLVTDSGAQDAPLALTPNERALLLPDMETRKLIATKVVNFARKALRARTVKRTFFRGQQVHEETTRDWANGLRAAELLATVLGLAAPRQVVAPVTKERTLLVREVIPQASVVESDSNPA